MLVQEHFKLNAKELSEHKSFWESQIAKGQSSVRFTLFEPSEETTYLKTVKDFTSAFARYDHAIQANSNAMYVIVVTAMSLVHRYYGQTPTTFHLHLKQFMEDTDGQPMPLVIDEFAESGRAQLKTIQSQINEVIRFRDFPIQLLAEQLKAPAALESNISVSDSMAMLPGYDLQVNLEVAEQGTMLGVALRQGMANENWLETYLEHLESAVAFLAQGSALLEELTLINAANTKTQWGESQDRQPLEIVSQFESIVERFPTRVAVKVEGDELTYAALNEQANRIAGELGERWGDLRDRIVGLLLEKDSWSIACMLGVLKAGGAYLPMALDTPLNRVQHIVENSGMQGLITVSDQMFNVQEFEVESIYIDIEYDGFAEQVTNPALKLTEDQLAYVIYTSGSTGQPKGVRVGHTNIINTLRWRQDFYRFNENHACLQLASHAFDSSVEDIYGMLLAGGTVVIPVQEKKTDAAYLIDLLITNEVSHLLIVPSLYRILLNDLEQNLPHLKAVTVAGEATNDDLVKRHYSQLAHTRLINEYGPTECSVCATFKELKEGSPVTIGTPVTNTLAAVVNEQMKLLPPGIKGELILGGPGVAQGYIGDHNLNRQKFVEDSLFHPGRKLYKTGDLVRWNLIGELEFIGRIDDQVKIRGLRVEPAEISRALGMNVQIKEAVVVARNDDRGEKQLVAFYTAAQELASKKLRDFMARHVMQALIPSQFVCVDAFPLNVNGKIDHQQLIEMDVVSASKSKYAGAETDLHQQLIDIWEDVLDQNNVGIDDDFFELGGHSLRATTFISEVRRHLGIALTINEVFENTTIRHLSELIEQHKNNLQNYEIEHLTDQNSFCLSPGQLRLWVMLLEEGNQANYRMDCLYKLKGRLNEEAFERVIQDLFQRHDSLRTRFGGTVEQPLQQFPAFDASKVPFIYEVYDGLGEEEAIERLNQENNEAFDLFDSELINLRLVKIDEELHLFQLSMHHIISDGWSIGIFIRELMNGYNHRVNDLFYEHPEVEINYGDYSEWISRRAGEGGFEREKQYWLQQLGDVKAVAELPADRPRPERKSYEAGNEYFQLEPLAYDTIKSLEAKEGLSTFMVVLASMGLLVSYHSGKTSFTLGAPFSGRSVSGLKDLIGILINTLAFRIDVEASQSVSDFLGSVKKTVLDGLDHEAYPFDQILTDLEVSRAPNKTPLFEVGLTWQNHDNISDKLSLHGLSVEQILEETTLAQHDLWFYGEENNGVISFNVVYSKELFDQNTIKAFIDDFIRITSMLHDNSIDLVQRIFEQLRSSQPKELETGTFMNLHEDF